MRFEKEDIKLIASQLAALADESVVVEPEIDIPTYAVEEILKEFAISDENRYDELVALIQERHDLGQELTGQDVLHWIRYG